MALFHYYPDNPSLLDPEMEKRVFFHSLLIPGTLVFLFWLIELIEVTTGNRFIELGIYPLHWKGVPGILLAPFIHSGVNHLISNSVPLFILLAALIYFYRRISYRIFFQLYILSGLMVWIAGREAWHIGASGVVYALASFHFISGIIRNDIRLLTLSIVVVFLYGGLIWGLFPIDPKISWEGHFWGAAWGIILAFYYRKYTIRRNKFDWEEETEEVEMKEDDKPSQNSADQSNYSGPTDIFNQQNTNHT